MAKPRTFETGCPGHENSAPFVNTVEEFLRHRPATYKCAASIALTRFSRERDSPARVGSETGIPDKCPSAARNPRDGRPQDRLWQPDLLRDRAQASRRLRSRGSQKPGAKRRRNLR